MRLRFQIRTVMTMVFAAVFVYAIVALQGQSFVVRAFPWTVAILALALLALQLATEVVSLSRPVEREKADEMGDQLDLEFSEEEGTAVARRRTVEIFAWLYGFLFSLWAFGFHLAFPALAFSYLRRHGIGWPATLLMTAGFWLVIRLLFQELLHLPFPAGQLLDAREFLP